MFFLKKKCEEPLKSYKVAHLMLLMVSTYDTEVNSEKFSLSLFRRRRVRFISKITILRNKREVYLFNRAVISLLLTFIIKVVFGVRDTSSLSLSLRQLNGSLSLNY